MYVIDTAISRNRSTENVLSFAQRTFSGHCKVKCAKEKTFIPHRHMKKYGTCSFSELVPLH